MRRLLRKRAVECLACGTRLPGYVTVGRRGRWKRISSTNDDSFMKPRDGRTPDQLLKDLRRAESGRNIGAALDSSSSPGSPFRRE